MTTNLELEQLSFEIRLYEQDLEYKIKKQYLNITYLDLINKINIEVNKKFGEKRKELLKEIIDEK